MMDDSLALTLALWLSKLKANSIHLECNSDHACNYMSAAEWIDEHPDDFKDVDPEEIAAMKATNTIWSLQIYPSTPNGFARWVAPTMLRVIAKARGDWPEVLKSWPSPREGGGNG